MSNAREAPLSKMLPSLEEIDRAIEAFSIPDELKEKMREHRIHPEAALYVGAEVCRLSFYGGGTTYIMNEDLQGRECLIAVDVSGNNQKRVVAVDAPL